MKKPSMGMIDPPPASAGIDYLSQLPLEIHLLILEKLDYVEFSRFGVMCKAWRSIASAARRSPFFRLQLVPWLIHRISPGQELPKLTHQKKIFCELKLLHDSFRIFGSSKGWLLLNKLRTRMGAFLLNPITKQRISLPENPGLEFKPLVRGVFLRHHHKSSADEMEVVACFRDDEGLYRWRSQDKEWTRMVGGYDPRISTITDMIYHKGNIYAISNFDNNFYSIIITDMISNGTTYFNIRSHNQSSVGYISNRMHKHLVECDGELLLVVRFLFFYTTFKVSIFKYNPIERHCREKVESIGEKYALLVGNGNSIAIDVSTNTSNSFRANCVYFLDHDDSSQDQEIRFFDLSKDTSATFMTYSWDVDQKSGATLPPTFFMPSLT